MFEQLDTILLCYANEYVTYRKWEMRAFVILSTAQRYACTWGRLSWKSEALYKGITNPHIKGAN